VADALLGQAASLRLRQRVADARSMVERAVARASGEALCRARLEQAAAAPTPGAALDAYRRLADACPAARDDPAVLRAWAEALVRVDQRDAAWHLLTAPREPAGGDDEARLHLLAAGLAPDPESARAEYERALGLKISPDLALETEMRLALLDAPAAPE
jgi:hypothetical protein